MQQITIPSTLKEIHLGRLFDMRSRLFHGCTSLMTVDFCTEIQELISGLLSSAWWNQDDSNKVWRTYMFLTQERIAERLRLYPMELRSSIHDMIKRVPSIAFSELQNYHDSINFKLTTYEELNETSKAATTLLELALWKA